MGSSNQHSADSKFSPVGKAAADVDEVTQKKINKNRAVVIKK
jgi:hypothetical protein